MKTHTASLINSQWNYRNGNNVLIGKRCIHAESTNLVCEVHGSQFPLHDFIGEYGGEKTV
jgi:hypothetical protein